MVEEPKASSAPPAGHEAQGGIKKPRTKRGSKPKSHRGDTSATREYVKTDVSPSNYLEIIATHELQEEDKLPASVMRQWKEANDQSNFKHRIDHGPTSNYGMRFMKENYLKVVQSRPARSVEKRDQ